MITDFYRIQNIEKQHVVEFLAIFNWTTIVTRITQGHLKNPSLKF